jgi:hypothetical protein
MKKLLRLGVVICGLMLITTPCMAAFTDTFTGGGSVTSGTDPLGNPWLTQVTTQDGTGAQTIIWGIPGYDRGTVSPSFSGTITDFHFSTLAEPGTDDRYQILATSQTLGGLTTETRFDNVTGNVLWNRIISADGFSVDFIAPSIAAGLHSGDSFFVNIDFTPNPSVEGLSEDDLFFTAHFTGTAVPEPMTLLLLGFGLLGLAGTRKFK